MTFGVTLARSFDPKEVLGILKAHLPKGWQVEAKALEQRPAIRLIAYIDIECAELQQRHGATAQRLADVLQDALFDTFTRWRGAQPMPDRYWRQ